jgi:hypothetical protein
MRSAVRRPNQAELVSDVSPIEHSQGFTLPRVRFQAVADAPQREASEGADQAHRFSADDTDHYTGAGAEGHEQRREDQDQKEFKDGVRKRNSPPLV